MHVSLEPVYISDVQLKWQTEITGAIKLKSWSLTPGAHEPECYSTCLCVCVCLSVCLLPLAAASFISTFEIRYEQLYYSILLIFYVWIFIKMLRSEVMASFAYRDSLRRYCSDP